MKTDWKINEDIARKVLATIDAGLVRGVGTPKPGQMCIEAATCYALGLPHGDEPECVSRVLRELKITLNDQRWSTNAARAAGLRRLGLAQLGSRDNIDDTEFAKRVVTLAIRTCVSDHPDTQSLSYMAHFAASDAAATYATVYAVNAVTDADANHGAARDKVLADFAEGVVQILIDMKAPGVQWLALTEGDL